MPGKILVDPRKFFTRGKRTRAQDNPVARGAPAPGLDRQAGEGSPGAGDGEGGRPLLEIRGLVKKYDKEVLNIGKLNLEKGKIYGIIGPSGSGKSTLLRLVNLLEKPTAGSIFFKGRPLSFNGRRDLEQVREMSLMFQKPVLFRSSVKENVAYGMKARGVRGKEVEDRVMELLDKVGLAPLAHRQARSLSGGEAQRVALARAVAFEPGLLLLDEPTANLDPVNVEIIERLVLDLNRSGGITVIIVTHNIFQARRITGEIIFLYGGKVVENGETEKIFSSPGDPRTKAFVEGKMVY